MSPFEVAQAIKSLTDAGMQELVSLMSNDGASNEASTMGTLCYVFTTSKAAMDKRATKCASLRIQAAKY